MLSKLSSTKVYYQEYGVSGEKVNVGILSWIIDRQRTGVDNYLYYLLKTMIKMGKFREMFLIHHIKTNDYVYEAANDIIIPKVPSRLTYPIGLPYIIKKSKIDILHVPLHWPLQITPFFFNFNIKKVLTIHDLTPLLFPETHTKENLKWWVSSLNLIKNRTDVLIADSLHTKNDCINYLNIPAKKIKVIHLAADSIFKSYEDKEEILGDLKRKYCLKSSFILFVGTLEKRKNIPNLIRAFHKLKKRGIEHKLIIIGGKGWKYDDIFNTVNELNLKKDVLFMGYVPNEDLVKFYNAADLFVYPSLYEGFGLPPLEAMACGCPVITSNTSSLPEVVGDAGITIDPHNCNALADAMYEILTKDSLRLKLSDKSLKRAKMFSWEKTARETWKIYEEVIEKE